ncbi:MAG: LPS assembly lipoprotein LptE [Bryobacteraceae bacterium]|jgi:outer membrane lipopolysaccharide assembly protein LptE/RlpB
MNRLALAATLGFVLLCGGCGYKVAGRGNALPKNIKTIAVPAFTNATTLYHLADRLPADITREFISRTRYRVVTDPAAADAVLKGSVSKAYSYAVTLDPTTSRASSALIAATIYITLTDRATGKVLYSRNMEAHERYEVSPQSRTYFEETDAALGRMSRDVARDAVSAILEKF